VSAQCNINFAKTFDVANEPITEGIEFQIEAESPNADKKQLQEMIRLAEERCPAMYSMKHEIKAVCRSCGRLLLDEFNSVHSDII
jgi:uncharacterized OsmC-like protein